MIHKIALVLLFGAAALLFSGCGEPPRIAEVGDPAPDFTLEDLSGRTWTLSELKGKVVFINFWATWCPPCREEMPSMQRLADMMPEDSFVMLALLNRDAPSMGANFVRKLGVTMPILNDQGNQAGRLYGITGLPETFIVDKQGILREKYIGPAQWDSPVYQQLMKKYIAE